MDCKNLQRGGVIGSNTQYKCVLQEDLLCRSRIRETYNMHYGSGGFQAGICPLEYRKHPGECPAFNKGEN